MAPVASNPTVVNTLCATGRLRSRLNSSQPQINSTAPSAMHAEADGLCFVDMVESVESAVFAKGKPLPKCKSTCGDFVEIAQTPLHVALDLFVNPIAHGDGLVVLRHHDFVAGSVGA